MKICFVSDIHLEAGRDLGHGDFGPGSRFDDQVKVLERIATLAFDEKIDVVAIVGDVFHKPSPLPQSMLAFQKFVAALAAMEIRVVVIVGNHDVKSAALPTALDLWRDHADVTLASSPRLIPVDDVVFACLPWTPMSVLVAQEGRTETLRDTATELLIRSMGHLRLQADSNFPDALPILLAHWSVSGSSLPNGLPVDQLSEVVLPWLDIDSLGWKLAALGHIHQVQVIADGVASTPIFYCGSACVGNLGEIGSPHGCWIYDTEADELRFVEVEDRPFIDRILDYDPETGVATHEPAAPVSGAIVRIRYRANGASVDETAIRRDLTEQGAHKVFIKEIDRPTASRSRLAEPVADDVTTADALGLWLEANDVAASRNGDGERFLGLLRERHLGYVERLGA